MKDINILEYLNNCIINDLKAVDFEFIQDSQTEKLIEVIKEKKPEIILDYGCGNCRFYNAINNCEIIVNYIGYDIETPINLNILLKNKNFNFISNLKEINNDSIDCVICCNVFHELSILDLLTFFEDCGQKLKNDGEIIIMDTSFLPKGELEATPLYYFEFDEIYNNLEDKSYTTRSGYDIMFFILKKKDIPDYLKNSKLIETLFIRKRNSMSDFAIYFCKNESKDVCQRIIAKLGISPLATNINILAYLMYLSGVANYKLIQYYKNIETQQSFVIDGKFNKNYLEKVVKSEFLTELIILSEIYVLAYGRYIKIKDVYIELSNEYNYEKIKWGIETAINIAEYFWLWSNNDLVPTNYVTEFINNNPIIEEIIDERLKLRDSSQKPNNIIWLQEN